MEIRIKDVARRKGWTLFDLYLQWDALYKDGISHSTIYNWQRQVTQPSWENIEKLCFLLECEIGDLFQPVTVQYKGLKRGKIKSRRPAQ